MKLVTMITQAPRHTRLSAVALTMLLPALTPTEAATIRADLAKWEPLVSLSIVPISGAVTADGNVVLWAGNNRTGFGGGGQTYTTLFNPKTNTAAERLVTETAHEMFCTGTSVLPDGRLLVNGGVNANLSSIYDPVTKVWSNSATMNIPRGYNSNTVLSDGSVMTFGGSWSGGTAGGKNAEIYTPETGWRVLTGVPYDPYLLNGVYQSFPSDSHAMMIPTGNGRVLLAGPSPNMGWIDTRGNGSNTPAGRRGDEIAFGGTAVMYDSGKILIAGGANWKNSTPAIATTHHIDTTNTTAVVRKLTPMAYPRMYANSVVLPNGQVLVVGGQTYVKEFSDDFAVLAPELWDPNTETFTTLPPMAVARNYHSMALLLPDGRVMSAGGGLCNCPADKPNLQIMSPPYLFNSDGTPATRPAIITAPETVGYGTIISVTTSSAVTAFSMIRLNATTHTVNNDQRRIALGFTSTSTANKYSVSIPSNAGILIPGQWMLFAMNANGTPSAAKIITVSRANTPTIENPGNINVTLGNSINLSVNASTPSGTLTYSANGLPSGVSMNSTTGLITGMPTTASSHLVTLRASNGTQTASTDLLMTITSSGSGTGLLAQYFNGTALDGAPLLQRIEAPYFDWGYGSPSTNVPDSLFSVRWSGWIEATSTGVTQIRSIADDGIRVWIDNRLVIDNWVEQAATAVTAPVVMTARQRYRITIEYYDAGGLASAQVQWLPAGASTFTAIPAAQLHADTAPSTTNLALNKLATQSSDYPGGIATQANDGNNNSISHTLNNPQEWWQVDLGGLRKIDLVQLWNRLDCCGERLANFTIFVSKTNITGRTFNQLNADPTVVKREVSIAPIPNIGIPIYAFGRYVRVQLVGTNFLQLSEVKVLGSTAVYHTPSIRAVSNQTTSVNISTSLTLVGTDPDGNALTYSATGLPTGLEINANTGRISGIPTADGTYSVTATVKNEADLSASTTFNWTILKAVPIVNSISAPVATSSMSVSYTPDITPGTTSDYSWNFGDGSTPSAWSTNPSANHTFTQPGIYTVTLTVRTSDGRSSTTSFMQAVVSSGPRSVSPSSSNLLLEPRATLSTRLWVVNQDNNSVSVFDTANNTRLAEITVGTAPRALARAADGRIWVTNKNSATISIINPSTLTVAQTVTLPRASQPFGIVVAPTDGSIFVALEARGEVRKLNSSTGATISTLIVGNNPRHLAINAASTQLLVSRFITPPQPGESGATINTAGVGGELIAINPSTMTIQSTIVLSHSTRADSESQGRGVPNYLGAAAISPDSLSAWVPSKQDNILRGMKRDGQSLNFQNTVRAISSRINLTTRTEDAAARIDHDNAGVASAATYHPKGAYLFVALENTRQIAVIDPIGKRELFRFEAGLAPQGVLVSADGLKLYAHNFMSRTISVFDLAPLVNFGKIGTTTSSLLSTIGTEKLTATVLKGKQLFYDARDTGLARDGYLSCAACHNDGGHDGRTWDISAQGEGLRNTINLRGRGGMAHGFLHWSANFDEVEDFEGQIRDLAGGTGLMTTEQFNTGSRKQPLGDAKTGVSVDLTALAAYVKSLNSFASSPWRNSDGTLTADAQAGRTLFAVKNCVSCHSGTTFSNSGDATKLANIGTIKASSGNRLNGPLIGIDTPTLRDVWATAPYLHDGSAATLANAVTAHNNVTLTSIELANMVQYLSQIGQEDPGSIDYNVAQGKSAVQSSIYGDGVASRAVDGNTSGNWYAGSVTHTKADSNAWWQVNFGSAYQVNKVRIWNRTDCLCSSRLSNFHVDLLGQSGNVIASQNYAGTAGTTTDINITGSGVYSVRIQLNGTNYMHLAEVEVFGQ